MQDDETVHAPSTSADHDPAPDEPGPAKSIADDAPPASGDSEPQAETVEPEAAVDVPRGAIEAPAASASGEPGTEAADAEATVDTDPPPSGGGPQPGSPSVAAGGPRLPTSSKEETMATGTSPSSGTCGQLQNPGNSNPSSLTLTGQKPYLVITYSQTGKDPLKLTFNNNARMVLCPGSSACYDMKGVTEVVITFTGIAQFNWCWTDEATSCCSA